MFCICKMPTIVTKYSETPCDLDDVVKLIVPSKYATPQVMPRQNARTVSFRCRHWDLQLNKYRNKDFKTLADAETFGTSVSLTHEQRLRDVTVREILADVETFQKFYRLAPISIDYEAQYVPLDPLYLGIHLGDGHTSSCGFTTADKEILEYVTNVADEYDLEVVKTGKYSYRISKKNGQSKFTSNKVIDRETITAALTEWASGVSARQIGIKYKTTPTTLHKYKALFDEGKIDEYYDLHADNPIFKKLKDIGVIGNKHIPDIYLHNSRDVRLKVLAGIIDTDGHLNFGGYSMCFANKRLAEDIIVLARSLGFICADLKEVVAVCTNAASGRKECQAFRFRICGGNELRELPILMPHKRIKEDKKQRYDCLRFEVRA
jgi:replicative DNA helicase